MQGVCGWLGRNATQQDTTPVTERMAASMRRTGAEAPRFIYMNQACLGASHHHSTAVSQDGELVAALCGHPRWRDPDLDRRSRDLGMAETLAQTYREQGTEALAGLGGPFAAVVLNVRSNDAVLAVDRMGISSLFFSLREGCLVFGSTADIIKVHPSISVDVNLQSIFNYVYFHVVPGPETVYRGIHRILPGQYVQYRDGKLSTHTYWTPEFSEAERKPFDQLKEEFRDTLRLGVRRASEGTNCGAFLSGGTDSSTIAAMLGEVSGQPAHTYSIGFDAPGYDEMEYARIAARHFGTDHHEYYVTPDDVVAAIPLIAQAYSQPYGNSSAVPTYYCARLAKADGIDTLLGGDGGDELFGGNARYAKQRIFELYHQIPGPLRRYLIQPTLLSLPAGLHFSPLRKLRSYIDQAMTPMPGRMESYNLVNRIGPDRLFSQDFLDATDREYPVSLLSDIYNNVRAKTLLNKMLALDFKFTLADNDLPKVERMSQVAGIEARFPMLDDDLVAFSTRLDPQLKLRGTKLRYFFKEALRDYLPQEILTKTKHGFGLPFGPWLKEHKALQDLVYDSLSQLKRRRIFRSEFIDTVTGSYLHEHPDYYGTIVWVMVMLEFWHQMHMDAGAP